MEPTSEPGNVIDTNSTATVATHSKVYFDPEDGSTVMYPGSNLWLLDLSEKCVFLLWMKLHTWTQ